MLRKTVFRHNPLDDDEMLSYHGFDSHIGKALLIKRVHVKNVEVRKKLADQIKALKEVAGCRGMAVYHEDCGANGERDIVQTRGPSIWHVAQHQGVPSQNWPWTFHDNTSNGDWNKRLSMLQGLLDALRYLHLDLGWLHTGIQPCMIEIHNLGTHARKTNKTNSPPYLYPPEVEPCGTDEWGSSVDIWMLALTLIRWWFHDHTKPFRNVRDMTDHREVIQYFTPDITPMDSLIKWMLTLDVSMRPGASTLLMHPSFNNIAEIPNPESQPRYNPFYVNGKRTPEYNESLLLPTLRR